MSAADLRVFVCYLSGLDLRRIDSHTTPFLAASLATLAWARLRNLPSNELLPTMLTGVYPARHGVWGVRLRRRTGWSPLNWLLDRTPDLLTTTIQCIAHQLTSRYDLPAIPPRRRRHFEITRTKYKRRRRPHQVLGSIGGVPSVLGVPGPVRSRYRFSSATNPERMLLPQLGVGEVSLDILELYSLDRYQQWQGNEDRVRSYYASIDRFLAALQHRCRAADTILVLLSDHGHEPVRGVVDLVQALASLGLGNIEFSLFLELSLVRFWCHSARARERIPALLRSIPQVQLLSAADLAQYHLDFSDGRYGEIIAIAEPGHIFFPHDFYQPLANAWLALTDSKQLARLTDARQRHNHGYLPDHACEQGCMAVLDERCALRFSDIELIDVAPSLLGLLGVDPPETMRGRAAFTYVGEKMC
jgi:hypothetical protein